MLPLRMLGILMLMFSLCDADSSCPDDINPLSLDPPQVIGKYGDTVPVNCSNLKEDHDGMLFKLGNTYHNDDDDENFISGSLSLTDWSVKAECRIHVNATLECSRELGITIYKTPDTVTVSAGDGPMKEGREYTLDCNITNVAPVQNLTVIWYRDNEKLSMKTFNGTTVTPVNVSSSLSVTADSHHNGAHFRCEAELQLGPELSLTTASLPYTFVVYYGPLIKNCSGPFSGLENEFSLNMLPCEADGNPPPTMQWYYQNQEIDADVLLNRNDSGEYTVVIKNAIRREHSSMDITIGYGPSFACNDHYEVKEGDFSQSICEPEGLPRPVITWWKDGEEIPTPQRWTRRDIGRYSLRATNTHGTATHALYLDVLYCPLILTPAEVVVRFGDPVSVNCSTESTTDFLGIRWEAAFGGTGFEDKSFLTWKVEKVEEWDIQPQCYMARKNGKQCFMEPDITVYKTPDTVTVSAVDGPMVEGREYTLDCNIINVAPVKNLKVIWYRDNEELYIETFNGTTVTPDNATSFLRVTADRHHNGAHFRCEAELQLGPELNLTTASLPHTAVVHYGPSFACDDHYVVKEGDFSQTLCEPEGLPRPNITWLKDGKEIPTPQRWTRRDIGNYSLKASNIHETATHALYLDVLYAPELNRKTDYVTVVEGGNVTLTCGARGNPPPVFTWTSKGMNISANTTNLTITQATTSATYSCTATNHIGTITKEIYVRVMKRQSSNTPEEPAETDCPLTLTPAKVVVRFGDPVSVNCSTESTTDFLGMGWEAAFGGTGFEDKSSLTWKVEKVEKWDIQPQCYMTRKNGKQCFMEPDITVYKTPDTVTVSAVDGPVEEGSMYTLDCNITNVAPVQNLTVIWYRDNEKLSMKTFNGTTVTPVNVSSSLRVTAGRHHNGAHFRCEAELQLGPELNLTTASLPHTAVVHYKPMIKNCPGRFSGLEDEFSLNMLPCEADGNPPPTMQWYYQNQEIDADVLLNRNDSGEYTVVFENVIRREQSSMNITIEYTPSFACNDHYEVKEGDFSQTLCEPEGLPRPVITWWKDGEEIPTPQRWTRRDIGRYSLKASNKHGTATHALDLDVLYCPLILTPAKVVVRFGDPVSVNCSTESTTDFSGMGWEAAFGGTGFEDKSSLTWKVEKVEEWNIQPQCYMTRKNGKQCFMEPDITVYKTPDTVTVSAVDGPMVEGSMYTLDCNIINVAPVQNLKVIWYRDNEKLSMKTFNGTTVTPVSVSSPLRVTAGSHHNGAHFRCEAELQLGPELNLTTASLPYTAVVYYKPMIKNCSGPFSGLENKFRLNMLPCEADGNPPPTMQWYYQNQEIDANELLNRNDSGEYTVVFENVIRREQSSMNITIGYVPSFACNVNYEVRAGDSSQTPCEPEGLPRPVITWFKDGREIPTPQRWTMHDSGRYSLKVTNKHGTATHALYLDVLYAPVFTEGNYTEDVISGENVTLRCSAEGNPPPEIRWNYKPMQNVIPTETTGRHQSNIMIRGATSTNAGVYSCTATNKVGDVTRAVTVAVRDKSQMNPQLLWLLLALLLISIIIITIYVRSRQKKHGEYNFVPSRATDGSDIPLSPTSNGVKA